MVILAGHQAEYLPYLGYFYKMWKADKFIIVDHIQYERHNWQNRNRIRTKQGEVFLTIPIKKTGRETSLNQIMIDNTKKWRRTHWMTFEQAYKKSKFWDAYSGFFKELYEQEWNYLIDINCKIIGYIATCFNITTPIYRSSYYKFKGQKNDLLIEMTKKMKCNGYLSGQGAKEYVKEETFKKEGLLHKFIEFKHPVYNQMWKPFMPNMSAVDLLFNHGINAKKILFEQKTI